MTSGWILAILPSPFKGAFSEVIEGIKDLKETSVDRDQMTKSLNHKMTKIRTIARIEISALALTSVSCVAVAHASGGEGGHHHPSIGDLTWFWVNFVIYVTLLTALVRKPLKTGWAARRARISQEVSAATAEVAAAERELMAVESLAKNIAAEQERARAEIVKQGELEAASLLDAAREKSLRVKASAKELLQGESRSAEAQFRAALVSKAVELSKARFQSGDFASRQGAYVEAAVSRSKRLVG